MRKHRGLAVRSDLVTIAASAFLAVCLVGGDAMAGWHQSSRSAAPAAGGTFATCVEGAVARVACAGDAGKTGPDPQEDFDFLAEHRFRFEPWLDPALLDNSDGVVKNTGAEWMVEKSKAAGLPFSFRVYGPENGAPAIVRRALGKGSVIVLGTAFWRGASDRMGLWWPNELETEFLADLLAGVGFPEPVCSTDDRMVWAQPYRSNNGLDTVAVLVSWRDDADANVRVRLRTPVKPVSLSACRAGGVEDVLFTWDDGVLSALVPVPAREVVILTAQVYTPGEAVSHWWSRQQVRWRELAKPRIDFAPYREGIWRDPALDLRSGARFSSDEAPADWAAVEYDDGAWKNCRLGILTFQGAPGRTRTRVRKAFSVPPEWEALGGKIYLISGSWSGPHYLDPARMLLNGEELHGFTQSTYNEFDVTRMLGDGKNVLAFEFKGASKDIGFAGNVYLYHRAPPARSVSLEGSWRGTQADGRPGRVRLPGAGALKSPRRTVMIPEAWRGRYRVMLYMEGSRESVLGAWVNGRMARRHHHGLGERCDVDITRFLTFGEENELVLAWGNEWQGLSLRPGEVGRWDVRVIRLDLFEARGE